MAEEKLVFDSCNHKSTGNFLYILNGWAKNSKPPRAIIDRFRITSITHRKDNENAEHEYLHVEVYNNKTRETQRFTFERFEGRHSQAPITNEEKSDSDRWAKMYDILKELAATAATAVVARSQLALMEEGTVSSLNLPIADAITVASTQSAHQVLESLRQSGKKVAEDQVRYLGDKYDRRLHGKTVRQFSPTHMTLFDMAILADVVHEAFPNYYFSESQCYFYSALVLAAAEMHFGGKCHSHPSDQAGRRAGHKVTYVNPNSEVVQLMISHFKEALRLNMDEVF